MIQTSGARSAWRVAERGGGGSVLLTRYYSEGRALNQRRDRRRSRAASIMASTKGLVASDLAVEGKGGGIRHGDLHTSVGGRCCSNRVFFENMINAEGWCSMPQ